MRKERNGIEKDVIEAKNIIGLQKQEKIDFIQKKCK